LFDKEQMRILGFALGLSVEFLVIELVSCGIGYKIDQILGFSPWAMMGCLLVGTALAGYRVFKSYEKFTEQKK